MGCFSHHFGLGLSRLGGCLLGRSLDAFAHGQNAQQSHLLAMADLAAIIVTAALLEDHDLFGLGLRDDLRRNGYFRGIGQRVTFTGEQDVAQHHRIAGVTGEFFDCDLVSGGNPVLLAARAHYCEHGGYSLIPKMCLFESKEARPTNRQLAGLPERSVPLRESLPQVNARSALFRSRLAGRMRASCYEAGDEKKHWSKPAGGSGPSLCLTRIAGWLRRQLWPLSLAGDSRFRARRRTVRGRWRHTRPSRARTAWPGHDRAGRLTARGGRSGTP